MDSAFDKKMLLTKKKKRKKDRDSIKFLPFSNSNFNINKSYQGILTHKWHFNKNEQIKNTTNK